MEGNPMKMIKFAVAAVVGALAFNASLTPAMANDAEKTISRSVTAFRAISNVPKYGMPPAILKGVQGIAIFPGLVKLDFSVAGRSGSGILMVRESGGGWSNPVLVTIDGGTLGWQVASDPMDVVLVFKDRKTVDALLKGNLTLAGNAAPLPGPLGATLKGATPEELKASINSYILSQGEFADNNLATATMQVAAPANDAFYGAPKVRAAEIISGKQGKASPEVASLQKMLVQFAAKK
jgi:lipid-binding SYLF domain-containing protein